MRAFTTPGGLFVWLPQAILWTKAKNGNKNAAKRFARVTIFWAQIGGWLFFLFTLVVSAVVIYPNIFSMDAGEDGSGVCQNTNIGNWGNILYDSYGDPCSSYT